ncbi:type II toxin-antitoxin system HicB family antitoxin [Actinopolymorpha rutila]|uniref:Putative RNase H-like HicB family nuclease n=1 Tax=Actinopolymorpha rutila TaxID=446787 RepID=A0A852ZEB2_9ACTN|nr:hypothetical protein [Actinopolymorpha rutila]NYH91467.1 putative RNase H-like HicB family nuclease [Actinopolymorpha rutila]
MNEKTRTYRAVAVREDAWWLITVPELDDIVTQARCVDEIEYMARHLVAIWLEVDYDSIAVDIDLRIPSGYRAELPEAEQPGPA